MPINKVSKVYSISDKEFIDLIKSNKTFSDCLRKLGLSTLGSGSRNTIKRRIKELNIDISHFDKSSNNVSARKRNNDELFVNDSTSTTTVIRRRILKDNLIEYKCAICGNKGTWNNKDLSLQLDHINGNHNDHRIKNLRFLCPNCHSQTDTYGSKNGIGKYIIKKVNKDVSICLECNKEFVKRSSKQRFCSEKCAHAHRRKVEHPSYEQLLSDIKELNNNMCAIGRKYGVTDNAIRKWIKKYEKDNTGV